MSSVELPLVLTVLLLRLYSALGRPAIDADPDSCGYRLGLAAHPRRNNRAKAAGRAPRSHDQQMIRRFERGMDTVAAVAHYGALSDVGPFCAAHARALVQEVGDVTLGPARALDMLAQLFRDHDRVVAPIDRVVALVRPPFSSARLQALPRIRGPLVHDLTRRHGAHDGDGGDTLRDAADDRQRLPAGVLLVLGKAICDLSRMAERGAVDAAGTHVEQIDQPQSQGAADDRGRAIAVGQRIEGSVR